ncbi:unnamed protein product [Spirodela intermedia]|uniref:Uncharacterized protein n=1 Tax=Spirodela intermedia TaxID=51605 RepID=A0A7I8IIP3_SPIIN|nr:unnamed protein product [Spirodela intermedia]CAA6657025.1 unnamed protein product [Spirodela intermedia]
MKRSGIFWAQESLCTSKFRNESTTSNNSFFW